MGTNYYYKTEENPCDSCGRSDGQTYHIGKSSVGWAFGLHVFSFEDRPEKISGLGDWVRFIASTPGRIEDEYGEEKTLEELIHVILVRDPECRRSEMSGSGDGAYELVTGEFS